MDKIYNIDEANLIIESLVNLTNSLLNLKEADTYKDFIEAHAKEKGIDLSTATSEEKAAFFRSVEKLWKSKDEIKNEAFSFTPQSFNNQGMGVAKDVQLFKVLENPNYTNADRAISAEFIFELLKKGKDQEDIFKMSDNEIYEFVQKAQNKELNEFLDINIGSHNETRDSKNGSKNVQANGNIKKDGEVTDLFRELLNQKYPGKKIKELNMIQIRDLMKEYDKRVKLSESVSIPQLVRLIEGVKYYMAVDRDLVVKKEDTSAFPEDLKSLIPKKKTIEFKVDNNELIKYEYFDLLNSENAKYQKAKAEVLKENGVSDINSIDKARKCHLLYMSKIRSEL